ncbi:unnamed protein product [Amaranthus hypochondriacus]
MSDIEKSEINIASSVESRASLLEQLGNAIAELKRHKVIDSNQIPWNNVEAHFRNLDAMMKKKREDFEAKEKEFTETETRNNMVLAEKEAAVVAKEQDLLDRLQELKDSALASIAEARETIVPEPLESSGVVDTDENEVNGSVNDENASLDTQDAKSPRNIEENVEGGAVEVNPLAELTQFCEQMDSIGLLNFVVENLKTVSPFWKEQLSVALGSAAEPAHLVLKALEEFFPPNEMIQEGDSNALRDMRQSCIILMEALSVFLSKVNNAADILNPETQQQAGYIANDWKLKLTDESSSAANGKSLEVEAFLRLVATFRIAYEFDPEEYCKYVLVVAHHEQATELCRSLDLTLMVPGLIKTLIKSERLIDAVHFICAFNLSEKFPPVPLLKTYMRGIRKTLQGGGIAALQQRNNARELAGIRVVIGCIEQYNIEDPSYPLEPLYRRAAQLDKSGKIDRKNFQNGKLHQQNTKSQCVYIGKRYGRSKRHMPTVTNPVSSQPLNTAPVNDETIPYYP